MITKIYTVKIFFGVYKKNLYHSLFGTGWHMGGGGCQDGDEHSLVSRWGHH